MTSFGILTPAETDLLTLSELARDPDDSYSLTARNWLRLDTPSAVAKQFVQDHDVVVIRTLGGVETLGETVRTIESMDSKETEWILVSGGGQRLAELEQRSSCPTETVRAFEDCVRAGGQGNWARALSMVAEQSEPVEPHSQPAYTLLDTDPPANPKSHVALLFYRAFEQSGDRELIDEIVDRGRDKSILVSPVAGEGIRDRDRLRSMIDDVRDRTDHAIDVVVSLMGFSASNPDDPWDGFEQLNVPWYQWLVSSETRDQWEQSPDSGLPPRDLSMKVILPEFDGRLTGPVVGFQGEPEHDPNIDGTVVRTESHSDQVDRALDQCRTHTDLRSTSAPEKSVAVVLGNHPNSRARIGNAVALDTPASLLRLLKRFRKSGYPVGDLPDSPDELMEMIIAEGSFDGDDGPGSFPANPVAIVGYRRYRQWMDGLPKARQEDLLDQWGDPSQSPRAHSTGFPIPGVKFGNIHVLIQPPRGYGLDNASAYHDIELPPTHAYVAFYRWITRSLEADAVVHLGKHGTLEWMPGRSTGLGEEDWPAQLLEGTPLIYPFVVNDPGEGSQAKRRTAATIVDHLPAPQRETDPDSTFDQLREALETGDEHQILRLARELGLTQSLDLDQIPRSRRVDSIQQFLNDLDGYATRSGLHVLGECGDRQRKRDYLESFSTAELPLDRTELDRFWRAPEQAPASLRDVVLPALRNVDVELQRILDALDGGYIPAGPSGAPTTGRIECLPTGRNFYAVDVRGMPTRDAWETGRDLAEELLDRHREDTGECPRRLGVVLWGTSNMRTGGTDVAQVLALLGVKPDWKEGGRVRGIRVIPDEQLNRPRIDPLVRISGFFRDAFPELVSLINEAVTTIRQHEEQSVSNFVRRHDQQHEGGEQPRVFGSKPGSYGAGVYPAIQNGNWSDREDLAEVFCEWGQWAYDGNVEATPRPDSLRKQLAGTAAVTQNRDNHEHDLFDSDDYFQFHGGMAAAVEAAGGEEPALYVTDSHDASDVSVRRFAEEAARTFHGRVANDTWQDAMRDHGYKGGFELAATVDYVFGYDATTERIPDSFYDQMARDFLLDDETRTFLEEHNPWAVRDMGQRMIESYDRGLWNDPDPGVLEGVRQTLRDTESARESTNPVT